MTLVSVHCEPCAVMHGMTLCKVRSVTTVQSKHLLLFRRGTLDYPWQQGTLDKPGALRHLHT